MFDPNILLRLSLVLLTQPVILIGIQFALSFVVLEYKKLPTLTQTHALP
jgi:hypothetical protein